MPDEIVDIVDKNGKVIKKSTRSEACKKGLLHPAVNILVVNSHRKIFLQRRSVTKSAFPLFWDISASEHIGAGEGFKEAAVRGLGEELSIKSDVRLIRPKHIQKSEYKKGEDLIKEYELVELYCAYFDGEININREEVLEGKFVDIGEFKNFNENNFTPWGLDEIKYILKNPQIIDEKAR